LHVLLGRALPEHIDTAILLPMRRGFLCKYCECRNELHGLFIGKLLRNGWLDSRHGYLCGGDLRLHWGHQLHGMLGRVLPERHHTIIMHPVRSRHLRGPCERCN
jgi:hypothetical protein